VLPGAHRVQRTRERVTLHTHNINGEIQIKYIPYKEKKLFYVICYVTIAHGEGGARGRTNDLPSG